MVAPVKLDPLTSNAPFKSKMAPLPQFTFPFSRKDSAVFESSEPTITEKRQQPQLQVLIEVHSRDGYKLAVPEDKHSRPVLVRTLSTPPASPRTRSSTMGMQGLGSMHGSGATTPPTTPSNASHSKHNSASSDFLSSLSNLRRGDSISSLNRPRLSIDETPQPGSTELITFPHHLTDYNFRTDAKGRKKIIGEGAWSDVYLADPCPAKATDQTTCGPEMTPPLTPVRTIDSGIGLSKLSTVPSFYAVKVPAMNSAKKVLGAEARILSYLTRFPSADSHVVPFHGFDTRTGSILLKAMDGTIESWIEDHLNTLDEPARAVKLAAVFPTLATSLLNSLVWLHEKGCIHADIKPSNILVSPPDLDSSVPHPVFSDFSSSVLTPPSSSSTDIETAPVGAGTWEYLDPSLLSSSNPATPSENTDLWSLAITLLFLVIGASPYDAFKGNKFQQREMIKSGTPLQCMTYGDQGIRNSRRLQMLGRDLGWDVKTWLGMVLVKDGKGRVGVGEWIVELEGWKVKI